MWVNQFYLGHYIDSCVGEYEMNKMSFYISHMKNIYHRMSASFNAPLAFFFFFLICRCTIGADQNSYCFLSPSQKYQEISRFHALPPLSLFTWEDIQAQVIHTESWDAQLVTQMRLIYWRTLNNEVYIRIKKS